MVSKGGCGGGTRMMVVGSATTNGSGGGGGTRMTMVGSVLAVVAVVTPG